MAYAGLPAKPDGVAKPLLVGNPDFDLTPDLQQAELQRMALEDTALAMRGVGGSRELSPVLFPPLPATGAEIDRAAGLVGGTKLVRRRALEGAVKRTSRPEVLGPATVWRCLHLAIVPEYLVSNRGVSTEDPGGTRPPSVAVRKIARKPVTPPVPASRRVCRRSITRGRRPAP